MKYFKSHSEFINEAKLSAIHKAAKKGSYPVTVVVVSNGSVTKQEIVNTPAAVPAVFNELQKEYPGATINIESKTGQTLFVESVVNEKLARGLKPLLKTGSTITKKAGEDALLDLSDKFDRIDDEYAGTIASWLDMAIELMQDGYAGDATKKLKQFNKKCKDVLNGKDIGSAFESVNEKSGPCWDGYKIGSPKTKISPKSGKRVNNCVPVDEDVTEGTYNSKNHIGSTSDGQGSNAEIYKKGKGYYVVVSGEADYDFDAKNDKELLKKLKDNEFDSTDILEVNEATDINDPVLMAFRATRRELPKFKPAKAKSRRLSFDKYMDLLDAQTDIEQDIKDYAEEMAQTFRDMEQEAEPEGGEMADKYGSIMMKQEKEYAKLKAKKAKIDARIEKHRMD